MDKKALINVLKNSNISEKLINAFSKVSRENFLPSQLKEAAYLDIALPIGEGQTISQPSTIAIMLSELNLKKTDKVLEIGSGCGYVLALLSKIVKEVYGVELITELAEKSKANLKEYTNVKIYNRNGKEGLTEHAPYNKILLSAAIYEIPRILFEQLSENGILVAPIGEPNFQNIVVMEKKKGRIEVKKEIPGFVFVPFIE